MGEDVFDQALEDWKRILSSDGVLHSPESTAAYHANTISAQRQIRAVLCPQDSALIPEILKIANTHRIPIYPISRGHNWGYGSSNPVQDGCVILDLSLLRKIIDFDENLGTVTVEPGVSYGDLREYLDDHQLPFMVPVHGGGPDCSLIGNALERGYGITPLCNHFGAATSIKAVLPDGTVYQSSLAQCGQEHLNRIFKWGIGPYLDGLFCQGNYGVVTQMTFLLKRNPKNIAVFMMKVSKSEDLGPLVETIKDVLSSVGGNLSGLNLMNTERILSMLYPYPKETPSGAAMSEDMVRQMAQKGGIPSWMLIGGIYGPSNIIKAVESVLKKEFKKFEGEKLFLSRRKFLFLRSILKAFSIFVPASIKTQVVGLDELFNILSGRPSELPLNLAYWRMRKEKPVHPNPAKDGCGLMWYSPLVPMKADSTEKLNALVRKICVEFGFDPLITLTSISDRCFDCTVPLLYDPSNSEEKEAVYACYKRLVQEGAKIGVFPYRVGLQGMDMICENFSISTDLRQRLKDVIDPQHIISPHRYNTR